MSQGQLVANRYRVGGILGQGGMGTVYRAVDTQTREPVALKLLKPDVVERDPDIVQRFQREGEVLRRLNHPNIVKILATEQENDLHYIVMEYVPGGSLYDALKQAERFSVQRTLYVALDLADALTRAHRLDIIHRDIKPGNVLLAEDGTPRLTDFGVARIIGLSRVTQEGTLVGTVSYLAPELLQGEEADAKSDIWAFGVMLFEMLTGHLPFGKDQIGQTITAILTEPMPDLEAYRDDVPVALADLVYRMLEKDPARRIPSVRLVGAELEAIIRGDARRPHPVMPADSSRFATPTPVAADSQTSAIVPRRKHNLPAQPTPFVGRDTELQDIHKLLGEEGKRLITLLGPGGMGKTRLALEAGERFLSEFHDGVFFIKLATLNDPDLIISTIADAIDFDFSGNDDPRDQLLFYLRDKEMLLILDNFEHMIPAAGIVSDILREAPNVRVLATSRERLRLRGETIYEIHGMGFPDWETPEDLSQYSAVKLFIQSARRVQPDFEVDEENAHCVARITRTVQGMPLGIELAAAWLEMLDISEIADEITRNLDFLETDLQDVPERQRSIRAVFDYSWDLLNEQERETFKKLAVFRGGFMRPAAEAVADASLRILNALVNKSLVYRAPDGRYSIHNMLHQYAEEKLNQDTALRDAVRAKHAQFYTEFLSMRRQSIQNRMQKQTQAEIEREIENIRAACSWVVDCGCFNELGTALYTLTMYYEFSSLYREGAKMLEQMEESLIAQGFNEQSMMLWQVRNYRAWLLGRSGSYEASKQIILQALDIFRQEQSLDDILLALNGLCYVEMWLGDYDAAQRYGEEATALVEQTGKREWYNLSWGNLGYVHYLRGNFDEAIEYTSKGLLATADDPVYGSPIGKAFGINNIGEVYVYQGRFEEAYKKFEEAHAIFAEYSHRRGMAFTLNNMGGLLYAQGKFEAAYEKYIEGYRLNKEIGDRAGLGHSLSALGNIAYFKDDLDTARDYYEQALAIRREIGDRRSIADSLSDLGDTWRVDLNFERAHDYYEQALAIRREIGDRLGEADGLTAIGYCALSAGEEDIARDYLMRSFKLAKEMNYARAQLVSLAGLGVMAAEAGDVEKARRIAADVRPELIRVNMQQVLVVPDAIEGLADLQDGQLEAAREKFVKHLQKVEEPRHLVDGSIAIIGLALVLAHTGHEAQAAKLLSALLNYRPANYYPLPRKRIQDALHKIEQRMGAQAYEQALNEGKQTDLMTLVKESVSEAVSHA